MKWAFVDYENVGSLNKLNLALYEKVIVFVGATQKAISFGDDIYNRPIEILYIKVTEVLKNNLDMHLVYYLGKYDEKAPTHVSFEIISNDKCFGPLMNHIRLSGRQCYQINWESANHNQFKPKPQLTLIIQKQKDKLIKNITSTPKNSRPQKVQALHNHVRTCLKVAQKQAKQYVDELVKDGLLDISENKIKYKH